MSNVFTYSLFKNSSKVMHVKLFVTDSNLKAKYQEAITIHNNKILSTNFPDAGFDLFVPEATVCLYENLVKINFGVKSSAMMVHDNGTKFPTGFYLYARSSLGSNTKLRLANSVGIIDSGYRGDLIGCFDCLKEHISNKIIPSYTIGLNNGISSYLTQSNPIRTNDGSSSQGVLSSSISQGALSSSISQGALSSSISQGALSSSISQGVLSSSISQGVLSSSIGYSKQGSQSNVICRCNHDYHVDKYDKLIQICAPDLCPIYIELVDKEEDLSEQTDRGSGGFGSTGR